MHVMALNAMIQAWSEGVVLTTTAPGKVHLSYHPDRRPSDQVIRLLKYYQPAIARDLPKETAA